MKRKTLAAGSALALLTAGLTVPADAQARAAEPTTPSDAALAQPTLDARIRDSETDAPVPMYSSYFVPFLDPVWTRIHDAPILGQRQSLFDSFDAYAGLAASTRSSRITTDADHPLAWMPLREVRVGETFDVPISVSYHSPLTSLQVIMEFNPDVLKAVDALGTGIPTEEAFINTEVQVGGKEYKGNLIALTTFTTPWKLGGPIIRIRFEAIAPGESPLRAAQIMVSDDKLVTIPATMRPGLVRVRP